MQTISKSNWFQEIYLELIGRSVWDCSTGVYLLFPCIYHNFFFVPLHVSFHIFNSRDSCRSTWRHGKHVSRWLKYYFNLHFSFWSDVFVQSCVQAIFTEINDILTADSYSCYPISGSTSSWMNKQLLEWRSKDLIVFLLRSRLVK